MGKCSEWITINRGVPQGFVLRPLFFNIFVNDLFYTDIDSMICNYANDNHLVKESNYTDELKVSLKKDAQCAISWFDNNYRDANPDKFSAFLLTGLASLLHLFRLREIISHLHTVLKYKVLPCVENYSLGLPYIT